MKILFIGAARLFRFHTSLNIVKKDLKIVVDSYFGNL